MKLKKGDRLRCVVNYSTPLQHFGAIGDEATVVAPWNKTHVQVAFDRDKGTRREVCYVDLKRFEKIETQAPVSASASPLKYVSAPPVTQAAGPTSKVWIIILRDKHGVLQPAHYPRPYSSEKQAHAVAKSMAERHRGCTFMVFEATGFVHVPVEFSPEVIRL